MPGKQRQGLRDLRGQVLGTINTLLDRPASGSTAKPRGRVKATIAGNSTMIHLLLGIPPQTIRLSPFVTSVNQPPGLHARELGLKLHPEASIDCLPGVASYVGADITAGVLSSGLDDMDALTLFLDVGTNGEMVMGNREWLVTCACSAGPAFEGAGVVDGMRATNGAIEEVWINGPDLRSQLPRHRQRRAARHLRLGPDLAAGRAVPDRRDR